MPLITFSICAIFPTAYSQNFLSPNRNPGPLKQWPPQSQPLGLSHPLSVSEFACSGSLHCGVLGTVRLTSHLPQSSPTVQAEHCPLAQCSVFTHPSTGGHLGCSLRQAAESSAGCAGLSASSLRASRSHLGAQGPAAQ